MPCAHRFRSTLSNVVVSVFKPQGKSAHLCSETLRGSQRFFYRSLTVCASPICEEIIESDGARRVASPQPSRLGIVPAAAARIARNVNRFLRSEGAA